MAKKVAAAAGISSEAVQAKTGKSWDQWFALLDKAGAHKWPHKDIAKFLYSEHDCASWWGQMITVGYEQARGLRVKNQLCSGEFSTNASKTFAAPVAKLFQYWEEHTLRSEWLPDSARITMRKAVANKSMRITWHDNTLVEINFTAKDETRSQAAVQHRKLEGPQDVARLKAYWAKALSKLNGLLVATAHSPLPKPVRKPAKQAQR
jgi:hypothetical protein